VHGQNPPTRNGFRALSLAAAFLTLAVAGLTACEDGAAEPRDTFDYVALGDSFTATGLPEATGDCRRSTQNYPQLIAEARPDITLTDVSCGGASTEDMLQSQEFRGTVQPPQFDALPPDADLVTVSLGGNDFGLYWGFLYRCVQLAPQDPEGDPCRTLNGGRLERRMDQVRDNLATVLEEAGDRAPDARVIFVGYPHLLPDVGDCPRRVPVAAGDADYVREMMALLVDAQRGAAEDAGVDYVDVYAASEGHDVCSDDPWVNDVTDGPQGSYNFHPMPAHQRAVADLILEML
jgi:lysophospholipase L1-like esterase